MRGILLLLVAVAGLGVVLWWSEEQPSDEGPELTESVLDGRSLRDAERLVIRPAAEGLPLEFERDETGWWRIVEPVRDVASAAVIDALRIAFDTARLIGAYEPEEVDERLLAETGLAEPRSSLRARWPDGKVVEIALGLPGPYGHDLFAMRTDEGADRRIYRVQTALRNALQLTPDGARERLVFRTAPVTAERLRIERPVAGDREDVLELKRRGTRWYMVEPAELRIDQGQTDGFVRAVLGLRIEEFLPGRPQPGLSPIDPAEPPDVTIDVHGGPRSERVELRFAPEAAAAVGYSSERDLWFVCEVSEYRKIIEIPIRALRAMWLLRFGVDQLETIRLVPPGDPVTELARESGSAWRLVRPIEFDADPTAVSELLQALRSLAVVDFVADDVEDMARFGLDDDAFALEVGHRRERPDRLLVGDHAGPETTWVRRADEPHVVTVPRTVADRLQRPWWTYVARRILRIEDGSRVRRIVRTMPDGGEVVFERGDDGEWRRGGEGEPLPLMDDLFDLLRDLHAEAVVADAQIGELRPAGSLALVAASDQVLGRFDLLRGPEDRAYAVLQDAPGVRFRLSARDSRDLLGLQ